MENGVEKYLKALYPDITRETLDLSNNGRMEQYNRDRKNILENFSEFEQKLGDLEITSEAVEDILQQVLMKKYMSTLYPKYNELNIDRKDMLITRTGITSFRKLDAIFDKMGDKNDELLYEPDLSDAQKLKLAVEYVRIHEESNELVREKTLETVHDPNDWMGPGVDKTKWREPSVQEVDRQIKNAVSNKNKFSVKNIINILGGERKVDLEKVLQADRYIKSALKHTRDVDNREEI